jgi:hypothetical protein
LGGGIGGVTVVPVPLVVGGARLPLSVPLVVNPQALKVDSVSTLSKTDRVPGRISVPSSRVFQSIVAGRRRI